HLMVESVTVMPAPSSTTPFPPPSSDFRPGLGRFVVAPNITEEESALETSNPSSVYGGRRAENYGSPKGSKAVCPAMLESLERERLEISPADFEVLREDMAMGGTRYCAICADEDDDPDPFTDLPCGHEFHLDCVKLWLKNNACCPLCRFDLPQTDIDYYRMVAERGPTMACPDLIDLVIDNRRLFGTVGDDLMVRLLEQQQRHHEIREESKRRQHARKVHLALLRGRPLHVGVRCARCEMTPIIGSTRYRCDVCGPSFTVCQECESRYFCAETHRHKCSVITVDSKQLLKDWPSESPGRTGPGGLDSPMRERLAESREGAIEE
ncbi:hypothetical protein FOZ62_005251, partial [Perkinsus olseni]